MNAEMNAEKEEFYLRLIASLRDENKRLKEENKALREEMDNNINRDKLTGLYNRGAADRAYESGKTSIMCDIDDFKKLNDTYGHNFGDLILVEVSKILKGSVRNTDYVLRWGGEEFVVFVDNSDIEVARLLAERIRTKVEELEGTVFENGTVCPKITMSFGVSRLHTSPSLIEDVEKTDKALYDSKSNGKNMVTLYSEEEFNHKHR